MEYKENCSKFGSKEFFSGVLGTGKNVSGKTVGSSTHKDGTFDDGIHVRPKPKDAPVTPPECILQPYYVGDNFMAFLATVPVLAIVTQVRSKFTKRLTRRLLFHNSKSSQHGQYLSRLASSFIFNITDWPKEKPFVVSGELENDTRGKFTKCSTNPNESESTLVIPISLSVSTQHQH
ncbi:hypothetical protein ACTA71_009314 [Dictyostelium dimigraforme]